MLEEREYCQSGNYRTAFPYLGVDYMSSLTGISFGNPKSSGKFGNREKALNIMENPKETYGCGVKRESGDKALKLKMIDSIKGATK